MLARRVGLGVLAAALLLILIMVGRAVFARDAILPPPTPLAPEISIDVDRAARHLSEAVRFPTISHEDPTEDDDAAFIGQRAWIERTYPDFSSKARRELAGGALLYTWPGSDPKLPPIVLMAHQDVVPVDPATAGLWRHPPFGGDIADGAVWGRGAMDDKGSLIAILEALETLAERGFRPSRTILVVSGDHEETNGGGVPEIARRLVKRDVHALFVLDEGLAIIENAPVVGRPVALIGVAEKGYATLKATAVGQGGHSSMPPKDTAATALARAVVRIADDPFPLSLREPTSDMLTALAPHAPWLTRFILANAWLFRPLIIDEVAATPAGAASLRTTLAPTMLQGSPKDNVLPTTAIGRINYRLLPGDTTRGVMARAEAATKGLDVKLAFEGDATEPTRPSSPRSGGFRVIAALVKDMEGAPSAPALMTGATDSRRLSGVTADIFTFSFARYRTSDFEMFHGVNERVSLDNLRRLTQFYARLAATAAG